MAIKIYLVDLDHKDVTVDEYDIKVKGKHLIDGAFADEPTGVVAFGEDGEDSGYYVAADSFETWLADFPDRQDPAEMAWYRGMLYLLEKANETELSGAAYEVIEFEED